MVAIAYTGLILIGVYILVAIIFSIRTQGRVKLDWPLELLAALKLTNHS